MITDKLSLKLVGIISNIDVFKLFIFVDNLSLNSFAKKGKVFLFIKKNIMNTQRRITIFPIEI
jgi:hypothetical protein